MRRLGSGSRAMTQRNAIAAALLIAAVALQTLPAQAGHELPFYPSFYPQEIRIQTVTPQAAARGLQDGSLHAFIGSDPFSGQAVPNNIGAVESLGAYVIARLDGPLAVRMNREARCALARRTTALLARSAGAFTFHPYPVTPYHADYLHHFDVVESLKRQAAGLSGVGNAPAGRLRARGPLAERLAGPWRASGPDWDATIEEVDIDTLLVADGARPGDGWGPPWLKEGWFNAYLMLIERTRDVGLRQAADAIVRRIVTGDYGGPEEKIDLERRLAALLLAACEAVVLGYTTRREAFNVGYSTGIENIAFDSHTGLNAAIFIRTVKLKDFIWNGWLRLGIASPPAAAWNPLGGFTDAFGRLLWASVGDPALLPAPYGSGWIENRVLASAPEEQGTLARLRTWFWAKTGRAGMLPVPGDAVLPELGTGRLRPVGRGRTARTRLVYTVLTSAYHDGTRMAVADVLYPYIIAYAWSGSGQPDGTGRDPSVERSTAPLRERLVGFKVARVNTEVKMIGDIKLVWENPIVEAYLSTPAGDLLQAAAVAPPWASVPWHVLALMEEAARRRIAAFSEAEARRSGVEWLDPVRRPAVKARLGALVEEFESRAYVPDSLRNYVTTDQARQRWRALRRFHQKYGHFLVTNGPYRLDKWTDEGAVLTVVRDLSYPRGIGSFDRYPIPHRGYITEMAVADAQLRIRVDVEQVEKFQRTYQIVRGHLTDAMLVGALKVRPVCQYVGIGADGQVVVVGTATYAGNGTFAADLKVAAGLSLVMATVFLDENFMLPEVRTLRLGPR